MQPWAENKVLGLGPHWSENSASVCWPALKYLVLITATTFTLAGYCWNIIPKGLRSKGIMPLFNHREDGSHSLARAFFVEDMGHSHSHSRLCRLPLTTSNRKLWDERHFITLNYIAAKFERGAQLISTAGLVDFWTSYLITCPVHLSASTDHSCTNECAHCSSHRYWDDLIILAPFVYGKMGRTENSCCRPLARG